MSIPTVTIEPRWLSDVLNNTLHAVSKGQYQYLCEEKNKLSPVCVAASFPSLLEKQDLNWLAGFLPGMLRARGNLVAKRLLFAAQKAGFHFDLMAAHKRLFYGDLPPFVEMYDCDDAFAYRRIAGPNAIEIRRVDNLARLRRKIPISAKAVARALHRPVNLGQAVAQGRLFEVDFIRIKDALRPTGQTRRTRDSRWRQKYLPAPIAVFLEEPRPGGSSGLVPLAIRIDQPQPSGEYNPVYYPDEGAAWKLAKLYFEVADHNSHFACGHVYRTHFTMEPFCLATARQLSFEHPIHLLLRPHTRYTLATNNSAYEYFIDHRKIYSEFYAGTLEESRQILIQSHKSAFLTLELEAELASRGVSSHLSDYPYRDDARLWRAPIHDFVNTYVRAFYARDSAVQGDAQLHAWAAELMDPKGGNVHGLVPDDRLDTIDKLVGLLAQVLFIAGPGHAAQHFSEMYYYRYQPAFPAAAYAPPPWERKRGERKRTNEARFRNTVSPIEPGGLQFAYSDFGDFRYDRFGDYSQYPLGRVRQAKVAIAVLQADLDRVERTIAERLAARMLRYDFLLPSRVPNSINI